MEELEQQFELGHKGYQKVVESQLASNSAEYQQQVQHALQAILSAQDLLTQEHVFSPNEELDDIRTDYIKYSIFLYLYGNNVNFI